MFVSCPAIIAGSGCQVGCCGAAQQPRMTRGDGRRPAGLFRWERAFVWHNNVSSMPQYRCFDTAGMLPLCLLAMGREGGMDWRKGRDTRIREETTTWCNQITTKKTQKV